MVTVINTEREARRNEDVPEELAELYHELRAFVPCTELNLYVDADYRSVGGLEGTYIEFVVDTQDPSEIHSEVSEFRDIFRACSDNACHIAQTETNDNGTMNVDIATNNGSASL